MLHQELVPLFLVAALFSLARAGRAQDQEPNLPKGWCTPATGTATATTGECMCNWQHKDGCVGSGCQYQMGLSWYHHSCKDCRCVSEP